MKVLTTATFLQRLRELLNTYPHVIADIEPLIKLLNVCIQDIVEYQCIQHIV